MPRRMNNAHNAHNAYNAYNALKRNRFLKTSIVLCIAVFTWMMPKTFSFILKEDRLLALAREDSQGRIDGAAEEIDRYMRPIKPMVMKYAEKLSKEILSAEEQNRQLKMMFQSQPGMLETGLAFNPALRGGKLFAPHYGWKDDIKQFFQVEKSYDYRDYSWYKDTPDKGPHWAEPYTGKATGKIVISFCAPFYITVQAQEGESKQEFGGVCRANISMEQANRLLEAQQLGNTGYMFLVSKGGVILAHPQPDFVNKPIATIAGMGENQEEDNSDVMLQLGRQITAGEGSGSGFLERRHPITNQKSWLIYQTIPSTGWTLVANVIPQELMGDYARRSQQEKSEVVTGWLIFFLLLAIIAGKMVESLTNKPFYWASSIICSLLLVLGIGLLWQSIGDIHRFPSGTLLVDQAGVAHVLDTVDLETKANSIPPPIRIPTGVFVQSLEFISANNVEMTGYIWQKYDIYKHKHIHGGFIFPESVADDAVKEVYRYRTGRTELVGWYFDCILRQPFDYRLYPFDHKNVWLRIWPADFKNPVVLTPDLASYHILNPAHLPGVESAQQFVLNGWKPVNSFFEYKTNTYNSTFGMNTSAFKFKLPELYFVIQLERNFTDAFITNLVPLIVVLILLLATLITISNNPGKSDKFGANPFAILGTCAALFFVVLISHVQLRQQLAASGIIYMEYFYFIMYFAILWVSLSAFLIVSDTPLPLFKNNDGRLAKVLFLPANLLSVYTITLITFY